MSKGVNYSKAHFVLFIVIYMLSAMPASPSDLTNLTFNADPAALNYGSVFNGFMKCTGGFCDENLGGSSSGGVKFQYTGGEFFTEIVNAGGQYYWHTVIDQGTTNGFAQETYIKSYYKFGSLVVCPESLGYLPCPQSGVGPISVLDRNDKAYGGSAGALRTCSITSGCNPVQTGYPAGATDGSTVPNGSTYWDNDTSYSFFSPLDNNPSRTGIGMGNPQAVEIRQRLTGGSGTWVQEFSKPVFTQKPKITQTSTATDLQSTFDLDMTALDYNTNATPGTLTYTLQLASGVASPGDFNYATDKEVSNVTGGRYIYTAGAGYGGAGGTYTYVDGNFDPNSIIWKQVYDPAQNPLYSWANYYRRVVSTGSPTAYALIAGHWTASQLYPGSNQDCNATNLTCPSWQGWK